MAHVSENGNPSGACAFIIVRDEPDGRAGVERTGGGGNSDQTKTRIPNVASRCAESSHLHTEKTVYGTILCDARVYDIIMYCIL